MMWCGDLVDKLMNRRVEYWEDGTRVNREGVDVGRAYLELTGYANALRLGRQ